MLGSYSKKFFSLLLFITLFLSIHRHIFAEVAISSSLVFSFRNSIHQRASAIETCITGHVRSAIHNKNHGENFNSKTVAGIRVDLLDATGLSIIHTLTDERGFFSFHCPRRGSYYLNLPDYWSLGKDMSEPSSAWRAVESSDCSNSADIEITLPIQPQCLSSYQYDRYQNNIQTAQCMQYILFLPVVMR